ncbi:hypothetical protein ACI4B7_27830, partial [Klebsiella pneumoniae]|uniref:hypothetical protein n=1 Tax=Klebsiella pneumoniae TaxID=573 RepID=UPI003854B13D
KKKYDVYHLFQPFLSAYTPWKFLQKKIKDDAFIFDWDDLWTDGLFESSSTSIRDKYLKKVTACLEKRIPNKSDGVKVCSNFIAQRV